MGIKTAFRIKMSAIYIMQAKIRNAQIYTCKLVYHKDDKCALLVRRHHRSRHQHQHESNQQHYQIVSQIKVHNHVAVIGIIRGAGNVQVGGVTAALSDDAIGEASGKNVNDAQDKVEEHDDGEGNEQFLV